MDFFSGNWQRSRIYGFFLFFPMISFFSNTQKEEHSGKKFTERNVIYVSIFFEQKRKNVNFFFPKQELIWKLYFEAAT